jgi:hypothetical protein
MVAVTITAGMMASRGVRRPERVNPGINQLQIPEALHNDVQARVLIIHEVTAWAGEKFEGGEIRIL